MSYAGVLTTCWNTPFVRPSFRKWLVRMAFGMGLKKGMRFVFREVPLMTLWVFVAAHVRLCRDVPSARTLHHLQERSDSMTVQRCLDACLAQDFALAGLEYGSECCSSLIFFESSPPCNDKILNGVQGAETQICTAVTASRQLPLLATSHVQVTPRRSVVERRR